MMISDRFKHAIKTALAVVIAYGIALAMDWEKPIWAGYTVFAISLMTSGQGVQKGFLRLAGSMCGAIAGLAILAAFAQDRWLFIAALSIVLAICAYLGMGTKRFNYFWQQAGFFGAVVGFDTAFNPANAFQIAVERAQETATGIVVYTVIALLLWPRDSRMDMERIASRLVASLHQLFNAYTAILRDEHDGQASAGLRAQATALQVQFGTLLDAAVIDSGEVKNMRPAWRRGQALMADLGSTLDRWGLCLVDLRGIHLDAYLPALPAIQEELDRRLAGIARMLDGQQPERQPAPLDLVVDQESLAALSPFDRAAVNVARDRLEHLERTTRALFATLSEIRGLGPPVAAPAVLPKPSQFLTLDRDRLAEALRIAASAWLVFVTVIFIPSVPGGLGTVAVAARMAIAGMAAPYFDFKKMLAPILTGAACAFPVYIFLLPTLSEFYQLALVIFAMIFAVDYVFHEPRQGLWRTFVAFMFMTLIHVTSEQSYSLPFFINTVLQWIVFIGLLCVTMYVPIPEQPDLMFPRMVRRLLDSSAYLLSLGWRPASKPSHWRTVFHRHEVATLPQKLATWGRALPPAALGSTTPGQLQALVTSLRALSLRMEALLVARAAPQAEARVQQLRADMRTWRAGVMMVLAKLADAPESADPADLRARLDTMLARIEQRIETAVNSADAVAVSSEDNENMVRLLGAYRGVSEALIAFVNHSAAIDWSCLREARF